MPLDGLLYPKRQPPRLLPAGRLELDRAHPLARGLIACYVPGISAIDLSGVGPRLIRGATGGTTVTAAGPGLNCRTAATSGAASSTTGVPSAYLLNTYSWVWVGQTMATLPGTDFGVLVGMVAHATDTAPYWVSGVVWRNDNSGINLMVNIGGGFDSRANGVSPPVGFNSVIVTFDGTTCLFYANGALTNFRAFAASAPLAYSDSYFSFGAYDPTTNRYPNLITNLGCYYNRVLSPAEIAWLYAEPFAMVRPVMRRTYVAMPTAVVATTQARVMVMA